jgi:hypothetical protein
MKVASLLASGEKPSGAAEYLGDAQRLCSVQCPAESAADFLRSEVQLEALSARAARMVVGNGMRIQGAKNFEKGENAALWIGSLFKAIYPIRLLLRNDLQGFVNLIKMSFLRVQFTSYDGLILAVLTRPTRILLQRVTT